MSSKKITIFIIYCSLWFKYIGNLNKDQKNKLFYFE